MPTDVAPWPSGFAPTDAVVIGTVGRQEPVKNPLALVNAFARLIDAVPSERSRLRLVLIGTGPMYEGVKAAVATAGIADLTWLPGGRDDVPDLMRYMDVFVLPSLNEGISNTILEAMASGVPVVAAKVGGNPEIVRDGVTGALYSQQDPAELAAVLKHYVTHPDLRREQGTQARAIAEQHYTLDAMVNTYLNVYDTALHSAA